MMLLAVLSALAADPAYWSPESVAGQSTLFGKAQSRDAKAFEAAQGSLERAKSAVAAMDVGVALVGSPAELTKGADALRKELAGQFLRLQKHADLLGSDYESIFGDAVQRALPTVGKGYTVAQCAAPQGMQALMRRSSASCVGVDLNPALAKAIDADPKLQKSVADILTVDWPLIALTPTKGTVTAITGTARTVDASTLARWFKRSELDTLQDEYDAAIEQLSEGLESEDAAVKADAIKKAEAAHDAWAKKVAALGTALWPEAKKKLSAAKLTDVGVCPVPVALGGCGVPDATEAVKEALSSKE